MLKSKSIILTLILVLFALPAFSEDGPIKSGGWYWENGCTLNGKTFYEVADSYREQDGYAHVEGFGTLHYWLYDTYSYHNGNGRDILAKFVPDYVESLGYKLDEANKKIYSPNENLAFLVKLLMVDKDCDVSITFDFSDSSPHVTINSLDKESSTYTTYVYPLIRIQDSQNQKEKVESIYGSGVYGQTFVLFDRTKDGKHQLFMALADNKNTNKSNVKFYDSSLPTVFFIWSKWFTDSAELSKAIKRCKDFFDYDLNYVYLADMKDICDIAPCCSLSNYEVSEDNTFGKHIQIEYGCTDLELLFKIADEYNRKDREYVMQKYGSKK